MKAYWQAVAVDHQHLLGPLPRPLPLLGDADLLAAPLRERERAVKEGYGPIELPLLVERGKRGTPDVLPDALLAPASESSPYRRRRAIPVRQVLPEASRDEHVEDALDGPTIVSAGASSVSWGREQRLDEGPLPIEEMNPSHAAMLIHPTSVSQPPLSL